MSDVALRMQERAAGLSAFCRLQAAQFQLEVDKMGFRCGIVGLPNVGKSTLFNALTETQAAQAANYPFCTIEPNVGNVAVPDPRLQAAGEDRRFRTRSSRPSSASSTSPAW